MKLKTVTGITGIMLTLLMAGLVIVLVETASPIPAITQTNPTTVVYLDPATINGTAIGVGNTVTVNINISDAVDIYSWQAGIIFNAALLECTGFSEGDFLSNFAGPMGTHWVPALINNTAGVIDAHGCSLAGDYKATGDGQLANLTFEVKAPGVSDLHLRDVMVVDYDINEVPINIIDIYTVLVDTTDYTVVTVSNSTGVEIVWDPEAWDYVIRHSGFYDHSFNETLKELSFKVTGPYPGFSNVTIPKALLEPEPTYAWWVIIDGSPLSTYERTITENADYTSIHFTYTAGIHNVQITTRFLSSTISMTLSSTNITVGSTITISGGITPVRPFVNVTIQCRRCGGTWTTIATVITDSNGNYTYPWKTEKAGIYEVRARWEGDETYLGAVSDVWILTVHGPGLVYNINTTLAYCTIQEAIDAPGTLGGHTILVTAGTYYEHVYLHKNNLTLMGEDPSTTIIDGGGTAGSVVTIDRSVNNTVSGFTIQNSGHTAMDSGIRLTESHGNTISGNIITDNDYCGIWLEESNNNNIAGNTVTNNGHIGICLGNSGGNTLRDNNMTGNRYNFGVGGLTLSHYIQDIDVSNTVDGKSVYYLINQKDLLLGPSTLPDIGYLGLVNSTNITVKNLTLTNNGEGVLFVNTTNSTIKNVNSLNNFLGILLDMSDGNNVTGNTITNNLFGISLAISDGNIIVDNTITNNNNGIELFESSNNSVSGNHITNSHWGGITLRFSPNNTISGNNIKNNDVVGIWLQYSSNNSIYHNNFVNNADQVYTENSVNVWDDGYPSGGNYWSNYTGVDSDHDGIGDTAHVIDVNNQDNHPLMGTFSNFSVTHQEETYHVTTICNSTISEFQLNDIAKTISFNVTGPDYTVGSCRVTIPNIIVQDLWQGNYTVLVDGKPPRMINNWTDAAYTHLYFTYLHSEHEVIIIPEFPPTLLLPLLMIFTIIAVAIAKKNRRKEK